MRRVYTYKSIKQISLHPMYSEIENNIVISATTDLQKAFSIFYPKIECLSIHSIQNNIIHDWEDSQTALQQFLNIGRIVRTMKTPEEELLLHKSFIKNKLDVLNSIRILVEANIYPDDFNPVTKEEKLFREIWQKLEEDDSSFGIFRSTMNSYLIQKKYFLSRLTDKIDEESITKLILHGFYFITPIQERIFDLLENAGVELIFLCSINSSYPEVHEIWYKNFLNNSKMPPVEKWISDNSSKVIPILNNSYGSIFTKTAIIEPLNNVSMIMYDSELDFINDINRIQSNNFKIVSPDVDKIEDLLREYYPSKIRQRHIMSYPIGQYIYKLHSLWNPSTQSVSLLFEDIQHCLSTGWVTTQSGINGQDYMQALSQLEVYVKGCSTIEEWEKRLDFLLKVKRNVVSLFDNSISAKNSEDLRLHKIMGNPFLKFSAFNLDEQTLNNLVLLVKSIMKTASDLFQSNEINLYNHLSKILMLIKERSDIKNLFIEEYEILSELKEKFVITNLNIDICSADELTEAIMLIIDGGIIDKNTIDNYSNYDDDTILPLYQVEAAPITHNGKIHLCLADENRLPGKEKKYMWPISQSMLDSLKEGLGESTKQLLKNLELVICNSSLANRYLFFSLIQNEQVEISWISKEKENQVAPSPYIRIIENIFNIKVKHYTENAISFDLIKSFNSEPVPKLIRINSSDLIIEEMKIDLLLCPWRYMYNYSFNELPSFRNEFHYSFLLSALIGTLANVSGKNVKTVSSEVLQLFPYLRKVEQQQIIEYARSYSYSSTNTVNNISYHRNRLLLHVLKKEFIDKYEEFNKKENNLSEKSEHNLLNTSNNKICMFCPHIGTCPHSSHGNQGD